MRKTPLFLGLLFISVSLSYGLTNQATKKPAGSVTGTYKYVLNTIEVLEMPDHNVRISFAGFYPNDRKKVETRNSGAFDEIVKLEGRTATVKLQFGEDPCILKLAFQPNKVTVEQDGVGSCGFGFNVEADGTYTKVSSKPPNLPPRQ
jgi:hypothetical protein